MMRAFSLFCFVSITLFLSLSIINRSKSWSKQRATLSRRRQLEIAANTQAIERQEKRENDILPLCVCVPVCYVRSRHINFIRRKHIATG